MKFLNIKLENGGIQLGVKTERGILSFFHEPSLPQSMKEAMDGGMEVLLKIKDYIHFAKEEWYQNEENIQFAPCMTNPSKIICVGLNYKKHAIESNMDIPQVPILFNKYPNTISSHQDEILIPYESTKVDYEAELAIVIGKKAKKIARENALDYVFGYCNANDVSARDLQFITNQWLLGKCSDGFCPIGPYLVTSDEIQNPNQLDIRTYVNGELRQHSYTNDMIFACDEIISYISNYFTLEPGDIILTGTPEGVIFGAPKDKQIWLMDGDIVSIEIEKLGRLTNIFRSEN